MEPNVKDTVFLIAPSTPTDEGTLQYAAQVFGGMGFKTNYAPGIADQHFNWGNTAEHRAAQILQALYDPKVKAIYALEGGEGASEVVAELKKPENLEKLLHAPNRGIPLVGGSDITFLHHFLGEHGVVTPVQGPTFSYLTNNRDYVIFENGQPQHVDLSALPADEASQTLGAWEKEGKIISRPRSAEHAQAHGQNAEAMRQFLSGDDAAAQSFDLQPLNAKAREAGKLDGVLVGGYDQVTQMASYVTYDPQTPIHAAAEKPILFLESKTAKDLEATLTLMKESGDLARYQGIVLGKYTGNPDQTDPEFPIQQITQVLKKVGIDDATPVFHGVAFGHGPRGADMRPVPLYTPTTITVNEGGVSMSVANQAAQNDLDMRAAFKPEPAPAKQVAATAAAAVNTIRFDQPFVTTINQLYAQNMNGQDVALKLPFDPATLGNAHAMINPTHVILMPLVTSGKLQKAKSLTLITDGEPAPEFNAWLKEFSAQHLPGVDVSVERAKAKEVPTVKADAGYHDHNNVIAPVLDFASRPFGISTGFAPRR